MKVGSSALKHASSALDILHAAKNWVPASAPDYGMPAKQFVLGSDRNARLLKLAILAIDSGHQLVIHAMKARRQYLHLLD